MNIEWNKIIDMPYVEEDMKIFDIFIDQNSSVYFNFKVASIKEGYKPKSITPSYHLEILKVTGNEETIQIKELPLPLLFYNNMWLYDVNDTELYCIGYYKKIDIDAISGIVFLKIDKSTMDSKYQFFDFPKKIVLSYESEKEREEIEKEVNKMNEEYDVTENFMVQYLKLKEVKIMPDESVLVVGEQYHTKTSSIPVPGGHVDTYLYWLDDIYAVKLSSDQTMDWISKLPKQQYCRSTSVYPEYATRTMSFNYFEKPGEHCFFFYDNIENATPNVNETPLICKNQDDLEACIYVLNDDSGEMKRIESFIPDKLSKEDKIEIWSVYDSFNAPGDYFYPVIYINNPNEEREAIVKIPVY